MLCAKALLYWCAAFRLTFDARRVYRDKFFVGYYNIYIVAYKFCICLYGNKTYICLYRANFCRLLYIYYSSLQKRYRAVCTETESVYVYTEQIFVGYYIYIIVAYKNDRAHIEGRVDYLDKKAAAT